ncbi:MAG: hypothetical protein AAFY73_12150 [Pseudomonadota bacterium]
MFALQVGLILPVLFVTMTGGLDFLRVYNAHQNLQFTLDSAAYSAMMEAATKNPKDAAEDFINEALQHSNSKYQFAVAETRIKDLDVKLSDDGRSLSIKAVGEMETPFLSLARMETMDFAVSADASVECKPYKANYIGHAFLNDDDEYVMTVADYFQKGWAWVEGKFDLNQRQDIRLQLYFGTRNGNGADGIAFSIHNDLGGENATGQAGESLGVAFHPQAPGNGLGPNNEDNIVAPAIVVEFDTWRNAFDPPEDHTAVFTIGNKERNYTLQNGYLDHRRDNELMPLKKLPNLEDGKFHYARFIWDPEINKLIYFFDGEKIGEVDFDLIDFLGSDEAWMGFSASTGGAINEHRACFSRVTIQ